MCIYIEREHGGGSKKKEEKKRNKNNFINSLIGANFEENVGQRFPRNQREWRR